jgi:hypothetical protein
MYVDSYRVTNRRYLNGCIADVGLQDASYVDISLGERRRL